MKHIVLLLIALSLGFTAAVAADDVVENPAQPVTGPNAKKIDRTVKMTEVLRISDIGKDFFLKRPNKIRVAPDGSIFVMDRSQVNILKFSAEGKFITQIVKKGEGPCELINLYSYWLGKKGIISSGYMPVKLIEMDFQGKLINEFRVNAHDYLFTFMGRFKGKYYFYIDPIAGGNGLKVLQIPLVFSDGKGVITKTGLTFQVKRVVHTAKIIRRGTKGNSSTEITMESVDITRFNYAVTDDGNMYLSTDDRYLIQQYDFEKDKVVRKFRRQYTPIPYTPNPKDDFVNSPDFNTLYKWELYTDVQRLLANGDSLWVITSTVDKTKGILVDVYNTSGKYIDRFYLQIPNLEYPDDKIMEQLYYYDGFLYGIGMDDEDTPFIVKYKLEE